MHGTLRLFPVFISPVVWNMCEHLHYESVYFKDYTGSKNTIYRAGAAVVSTITSLKCSVARVARRLRTKWLFKSNKGALNGSKPCLSDF